MDAQDPFAEYQARRQREIDAYDAEQRRLSAPPPPRQRQAPPPPSRRVQFQQEDDDDDEEPPESPPPPPRRRAKADFLDAKPKPKPNKKRAVALLGDDDDDDDQLAAGGDAQDATGAIRFDKVRFVTPIRIAPRDPASAIPFEVRQAAITLNESAYADTPLSLLVTRQCSVDCVDPLVVMWSTAVNTGTCTVYLEDVVPVSVYLTACAAKLEYNVQVTSKVSTAPLQCDTSTVHVKPYEGPESAIEGVQSFGLPSAEGAADLQMQIKAHMLTLGPLRPHDVCDPGWIEANVDTVERILRREHVVVMKK